MSSGCRLQMLFSSRQLSVSYCAQCQLFHIDVGTVTLRLTETEFTHWSQAMASAQARYSGTFVPNRSSITLM